MLTNLSVQLSTLDELSTNQESIKQAYQLTGELHFKELIGGICNAPVYVYLIEEGKEIPVGVFKQELQNKPLADARFTMLDVMTQQGFNHHPQIIQNREGEYLTRIGSNLYSVIEYLQSDPGKPESHLQLTDMLQLTGLFHKASRQLGHCIYLSSSRLLLHLSRQDIVNNEFWQTYHPDFFNSMIWQRILPVYHFFSSEPARVLFNALPKQFIIGDNHQENIIFKNGHPFFIDLDPRRYDIRLHDFTSIIRNGSETIWNDYLHLTTSNQLFDRINELYGRLTQPLFKIEEENFHLILAFSYIEFFSWILNKIYLSFQKGERESSNQLFTLFLSKADQLIQMLDLKILKENTMLTHFQTVLEELQQNHEVVKELYHIEGECNFVVFKDSITETAIGVYQKGEPLPVCVLKPELENHEFAQHRFDAINEMKAGGFTQHPKLVKNINGNYLTPIGNRYYYAMEYIQPDQGDKQYTLLFEQMIQLTCHFHSQAKKVPMNPLLKMSRYESHTARHGIIYDLGVIQLDEKFFKSQKWKRTCDLFHFFTTQQARELFDILPKQLIIGDNNQTNIVFHHDIPYYVDIDERRIDTRLLDFGNLIRSSKTGALDAYLQAAKEGTLFSMINEAYSNDLLKLTPAEIENFHLIVAFTYIEYFSWALDRIRSEAKQGNQTMVDRLFTSVKARVDQVIKILDAGLIDVLLLNRVQWQPALSGYSFFEQPRQSDALNETTSQASLR